MKLNNLVLSLALTASAVNAAKPEAEDRAEPVTVYTTVTTIVTEKGPQHATAHPNPNAQDNHSKKGGPEKSGGFVASVTSLLNKGSAIRASASRKSAHSASLARASKSRAAAEAHRDESLAIWVGQHATPSYMKPLPPGKTVPHQSGLFKPSLIPTSTPPPLPAIPHDAGPTYSGEVCRDLDTNSFVPCV